VVPRRLVVGERRKQRRRKRRPLLRSAHLQYIVHMRKTLTIRTDKDLRDALEERARANGSTVSAVARDILREALTEHPMSRRTGHLRGQLHLNRNAGGAWRDRIRERNWRS
jgi:plasmid stability protein